MVIDAYAHCGRDKYLPREALEAVMAATGVSRAVLCQHLGQFDNGYLASIAASDPSRFAAVALVDHDSPTWRDDLRAVIGQGFRGLRVTPPALAANTGLVRAAAAEGLILLLYPPDGVGALIAPVRELAADNPGTPIVVSHLGCPRVVAGQLVAGDELLCLAHAPNVHVNLSGLGMFCPFPHRILDDLIEQTLAAFGPERVMWGSNFPVGGERPEDYRCERDLLEEGRWGVDRSAAAAI